jgi:hypothetical protein
VIRKGSTSGFASGESAGSDSSTIAFACRACIAAASAACANCSWSPAFDSLDGNAVSRYWSWSASGGCPRDVRHPVRGGSMFRYVGFGVIR